MARCSRWLRPPTTGRPLATCLVTGANRGIGLELTRLLVDRGDHVVAAVRRSSPELEALGVRVEAGVDVCDDDLGGLAQRLGDLELDLLVNNAGLLTFEHLGDIAPDQIRKQFEVNALGPLKVTVALQGRLKRGAKVALVTSRMGSIADNDSGGAYGYRMSKAALNMAGRSLAIDLRKKGVAVALLHPGWVRTGMTRGNGNVDPDESARGLMARIDELTLETSGRFWHAEGHELPW